MRLLSLGSLILAFTKVTRAGWALQSAPPKYPGSNWETTNRDVPLGHCGIQSLMGNRNPLNLGVFQAPLKPSYQTEGCTVRNIHESGLRLLIIHSWNMIGVMMYAFLPNNSDGQEVIVVLHR